MLTAEATPKVELDRWRLTVDGLVERPTTWTWDEIHELPGSTYVGDIHCVTTWSKFDVAFRGVSVDDLLAAAGLLPEARFVMAHSSTGYTTNLPLEDVTDGKAWIAWEVDGRPLPRQHGGPARLLVPHLYFWKSAKWVSRLELMAEDQPASGSRTATTTAATRGASSATRATRERAIDDVQPATTAWTTGRIIEKELPTPNTVRLRMHVEDRQRHRPGQHYLIRLRAPDDYTAQRPTRWPRTMTPAGGVPG